MASLASGDTSIDWLWGSLKPWQILHSTLAERQRCGNVLDVWELVDETLSASTLTRGQEGDGGRSHSAMHFLGDIIDGDFWRHGGVMESRVKECLNALKDAEEREEELEAAHHHHLHHSIHRCNTELSTIAISTQRPCTPGSIACKSTTAADPNDENYCKVEEEQEEADDQAEMLDEVAALQAVAVAEEEEEEEEEDEEEQEEDELDSHSAAYTAPHIISADNYSLIRLNYQAKPNYSDISRDSASVLVLSPCCSTAAGAAGDDQAAAAWEETANMAEGTAAPPDLEENIEVCAVCLEKLTHYYEEGVQALACRHAFHTVCIAPWLQRQPHACCPCCRAPIFPANLGPPLHLTAPLDLATDHYRLDDRYACAGLHAEERRVERASNDIMGLLADMEAALEHLGFRS